MEVNCVRRRLLATGDNGSDPVAQTFKVSLVRLARQTWLHVITVRLVMLCGWHNERFNSFYIQPVDT